MNEIDKIKKKAKKDFGKKLTKLIEKKKMTKSDLGKDLNIPFTTISDWCNGKAYPRMKSMLILAEYFNISYDDLVSVDVKKNKDFFAKDFKLCYIGGQKAFFTSNFEKQWGDDWDDAPYECNAEIPYTYWSELIEDNEDMLKRKWKEHPIELEELYFETHDWCEKKPCDVGRFSVEQINRGAVAWVITDKFCIPAGTTMKDFIDIITKNGGTIWKKI